MESCDSIEVEPHTRYVCVDFESNGFPKEKDEMLLPWSSIQVSLTAVENGEVIHLYDSYIQGAEPMSNWVMNNTKKSAVQKATQSTSDARSNETDRYPITAY